MGDPITAALAVTAVAGAGYQAHKAHKASKAQNYAASKATKAMDRAAKTSVVTPPEAAAPVTQTAQASESAVQKAAKKRFGYTDTVNNFTPSGLRKTLG